MLICSSSVFYGSYQSKYKETSNKPIGEDIKYRGGKQLRLICNGCDSFCVTVRMKRFRVAGEESVSKFFVIKDKSCLDHINCDPTKIKYEPMPITEEALAGGVVQNPKRRISTSTHRTSYLGAKKEEAAAAAAAAAAAGGLHSPESTSAGKKIFGSGLLNNGSDSSDDDSDSDAEMGKTPSHKKSGGGGGAGGGVSKSRQSYNKAYDNMAFGDLQGEFGVDPLSGLPNKYWTTRSDAKAELEVKKSYLFCEEC